jgi:RNA polymerase primary sigma factor
LDEPVGEGGMSLGDLLADAQAGDPFESAISHESRDEVSSMLHLLPERHREVIVRRYGFSNGGAQTHEQIGERLGVGQERSRQIEREALHRLRSIAAASAQAT